MKRFEFVLLIACVIMFAYTGVFAPIQASKARDRRVTQKEDSLLNRLTEMEIELQSTRRMMLATEYAVRSLTVKKWEYAPCQHVLIGQYEAIRNLAYSYYSDSTLSKYD